jgi:AcrR family transcriptional regulator
MSRTPIAASGPAQQTPLYRKLRPRPNGPAREEVVANQRARLHGAMVEASAARGYESVSVAQLCRLAGISKRTFYEQFKNKQDCLLASHERLLRQAAASVSEVHGHSSQSGDERELTNVLEALLQEVRENPKAARLVLVDARAQHLRASAAHGRPRRQLQCEIAAGFARLQPDGRFPQMLADGVVFGIEGVIRQALLYERLDSPEEIAAQLTAWAVSYSSPALAGLHEATAAPAKASLADAPQRSRSVSERARILRAAAEIAANEGLDHLTLTRIALRAGLEEELVAGYYTVPSDCLSDAAELAGLEAQIRALEASRRAGDGVVGICAAILALLEHLVSDPVARGVILANSAPPDSATLDGGERLLRSAAAVFLTRVPAVREPSWVASEATIGAVWGVVQQELDRGGAQALPGKAAHLSYLALAPVVGADVVCAALAEFTG